MCKGVSLSSEEDVLLSVFWVLLAFVGESWMLRVDTCVSGRGVGGGRGEEGGGRRKMEKMHLRCEVER